MVDNGIIALLSQLSGKQQPKLSESLLHPKELLSGFGCHFLVMSLSIAVLQDHIARSHSRQAATAAAKLPPPPPPPLPRCCRLRHPATATAKLPPLQPLPCFHLRLRRLMPLPTPHCRQAAPTAVIAFVFIVIVVAVIVAVSDAVAADAFSCLLIVPMLLYAAYKSTVQTYFWRA